MKTWLIFDVSYLCWRAYHSTGHLSHGGDATGTIYGFFKSMDELKRQFMTDRVVFCFDDGISLRAALVEKYKGTRKAAEKKDDAETRKAKAKMRKQIEDLKLKHLRRVGYRNVLYQDGYEGDDVIAQAVRAAVAAGGRAVVVTGDKDMYQLLDGDRVVVYHPREQKVVTEKGFVRKYGVAAEAWKFVKAIGGCTTDDVPGVPGCREKTALAFLTGKLKRKDARSKAIRSPTGRTVIRRNLKVVVLPMAGCWPVKLRPDKFDEDEFNTFCEEFGFASLTRTRPRGGFALEK